MHPENLEKVLLRLKRYKKPIFVLETGVADMDDKYRRDWINKTIVSMQRARIAGVNVQGYFHWSLFDNFEWAYGRWPRFGLIGIDYDNNLKRIPRKSAAYYAMIVKKMRGL
jgi:beta-glucosidase